MRKILLSTIGIMIMVCVIFLGYEIRYSNKQEVNNMMAIYLEEEKGTGKYQKTNLYKWPNNSEYALNMHKTYCENGSILRYNLETNKINVKVKGTDKCYVYFDKASYGTEEHPYLIQTIEDLVRLSNKVNAGTTYAGEYFLLTNDLDFNNPSDYEDANRTDFNNINGINGDEALIKELTTGSGFVPIGNTDNTPFRGTFDGGNKRIANLYINNTNNVKVGLFGTINPVGTLKNLTLSGEIRSTNSSAMVGGITGQAWGNRVLIENCHNEVNITNEGSRSTGGIVGHSGGYTIRNCTNKGTLKNQNGSIGGLTAYHNAVITIENFINYGKIEGKGENAGGLIGMSDSIAGTKTIIKNSHNEGQINLGSKSVAISVGGLIGYGNGDIEITNSYNIGDITVDGESGTRLGGLIGLTYKKVIINNSYNGNNTLKISPNGFEKGTFNGGLIGNIENQTEISIIKNSYNTGEIINGTRVGGLIGDLETGMVIDKCYNNGNIKVENEIWTSNAYIGGFIGFVASYYHLHSSDIVINSYNTGNIIANNNTFTTISGLLGNLYSNKLILLNSYNVGDLNIQNSVQNIVGIIYSYYKNSQSTENSTNILNNVYNLGTINGVTTNKFSLGYFDPNSTTNDIQNVYYLNIENVTGSNLKDIGTSMSSKEMKNQTFVDELNANVESVNLEQIDSLLKDYKLSKWTLGSDGYPTLINE